MQLNQTVNIDGKLLLDATVVDLQRECSNGILLPERSTRLPRRPGSIDEMGRCIGHITVVVRKYANADAFSQEHEQSLFKWTGDSQVA